jgi:hypothetical protein
MAIWEGRFKESLGSVRDRRRKAETLSGSVYESPAPMARRQFTLIDLEGGPSCG